MAGGDPTGADLCLGTTDGDTLSASPNWEQREITINTPIELTSGVKYAIIVRALSGDGTNYIVNTSGGNDYANGNYLGSSNSGIAWTSQTSYDIWFATKATGVTKDSNSPAAGAGFISYSNYWGAQTFTASSTYTITSIVLSLQRKNTPGTVTVSIRATVGVPEKATTPAPANAATNITLDQATLTWEDGGNAETYNVYYGTTSGAFGDAVSSAQAGTSFTVTGIINGSPYGYLITRYWRIDSTNTEGTTTGDEWSFTTIRLSAPTQTYWDSAEGYYYRLLIDADGAYGDHPADGGVEDTDYEVLVGYLPNFISTTRKLVGVANSKIWIEDI